MKLARSIRFVALALSLVACDSKPAEPAATSAGEAKSTAQPGKTDPKAADSKKADAKPDGEQVAKAGLPDAVELLDKAVVAQGGREKLDALESLYLEGKLEVPAQNIKGEMKLWWKAGDFYTEQTMVSVGTVRAGKHGDVIWSEDPINGLRKLDGAEAEQHSWASSPSLAAHWQRYFEKAETTGEREVGGAKAYDVTLTSKTGAKVTISVDATSYLPVAQKFEQDTPLGAMPVSVELKDYRDVGGLKLPHVQITDASLAVATQTLTKVEFGAEVDPAKFAMPTRGTKTITPATSGAPATPAPTP
jgi:hypothetical protein